MTFGKRRSVSAWINTCPFFPYLLIFAPHPKSVLTCLACLRVEVFASLAYMFYILTWSHVLHACSTQTYMLSCLCTWYPRLSYFIIEKLNSKKSYIEEFRFYSEAYLEPTQTSMMKSSCEKNPRLKVDNFFAENLFHRRSSVL